MTRGPRLGYRPSLDGLRALAVLAVLMAHFEVRLGSGGMVGVDVFFVLSGFLITTLLLQEQDDTGRIHFGGFYRRRAARLLPALTVMLAATAVVVSLTGVERRRTLEAAAPVLFYFGNWWRVAGHDLGPLGHTWSLAVEEQFYLIWPVLLLLTRRWWQATVGLAVVGVGVALAVRVVACSDGRCVIRTYHSTDTRMDGLLIGVMVAVAFHRDWLLRLPPRLTGAAGWGALAALAVIAISPLHWDSYWYDTGGMTATALLSAVVLVGVLVHEQGSLTRFLAWRPLVLVGVVSYGVYLYQGPTFVLLRDGTNLNAEVRAALVVMITAAATVISWRFVERPILDRARAARGLRGREPRVP